MNPLSPTSGTPENMSQKPLHTIVVSDIHLTEGEPPHPRKPLWKRYKRPKLFVDRTFKRFLEHIQANVPGPIELVFNGDIFDFDSVMKYPERANYPLSWVERRRGMHAEEEKSRFKFSVILDDHAIWVDAVREFVIAGNSLVFIIGNHDIEFQWPSVQQDFIHRLDLPEEMKKNIRFCEWFYISQQDTLIEHGNQYDTYCVRENPVHPLIKKGSRIFMRIPFGNLAGRFITNGLGLINPHAEAFIMSFKDYLIFFYKYAARTQPMIPISVLWSNTATLIYSIAEGLLPALKDPLTAEARIEEIAAKSNASPYIVRGLRELHVHPAIYTPLKILKELWLDRMFLLFLMIVGCFQFFSFINVFVQVSFLWFIVPFLILLPLFIFYARSVKSELAALAKDVMLSAPLAAQIARVSRVVHGHTHQERHHFYQGVEVLNTGTWSPAYLDVECTKPFGRKCFAWIRPTETGEGRTAELFEWKDPDVEMIPVEKEHKHEAQKAEALTG
jgi:UDP-2,3-diacylglucosamine pyrophosphatase LpxH